MISAYINKNDTVTQVSNDVENIPQSYVRNELVSPVSKANVTQNKISVNNNDIKFSLDIDRPYIVSFVANKHTNEVQSIDALYTVNAKKEVAALDEPEFRPINGTALTTSTISIFNLLDYVNNCFPDILPEERKISVSIFSICLIMQVKTSTAELRLIIILSILSILITKNKGNNDDTANAKALASTSETSVGNVSFNSSIFNLLDYVNNCFPDILSEEQKKDMLNYHAK